MPKRTEIVVHRERAERKWQLGERRSKDKARTEALWKSFKAPESLIKKNEWVDRPSVGIPYLYVQTGVVFSEALQSRGRAADAASVMARARAVAHATQLDEIFANAPTTPPVIPSGDSARRTQVPIKKQP